MESFQHNFSEVDVVVDSMAPFRDAWQTHVRMPTLTKASTAAWGWRGKSHQIQKQVATHDVYAQNLAREYRDLSRPYVELQYHAEI